MWVFSWKLIPGRKLYFGGEVEGRRTGVFGPLGKLGPLDMKSLTWSGTGETSIREEGGGSCLGYSTANKSA